MKYHDMIAAVGEGAAHPGGFSSTLKVLEAHPFASGTKILEVGCGTGRTACLLAESGYRVTALEINARMLEKAKQRAGMQNVHVEFFQGDVRSLPFDEGSFDVVFVESVTVFTEAAVALKEYYRVLQPGGRLFDREMYKVKHHPELEFEMRGLYGNDLLPTDDDWMNWMYRAGFKDVNQWTFDSENEHPFQVDLQKRIPDPYQIIDLEKLTDPSLFEFSQKNEDFIHRFKECLSFAIFIAEK